MKFHALCALAGISLMAACAADTISAPAPGDSLGTLRAALTAEELEALAHDVVAVRVDVLQDGALVASKTVSLEEEVLPPHILGEGDTSHVFADALFVLAPGTYQVVATPLQESGEPSEWCAPITGEAEVAAEQTTEILLLSQCEGDPDGALDVIVALNDPPHIAGLDIAPSKFITVCETAQLTVDVSDPNGDALTFAWSVLETPAGASATVGPAGNPASFDTDLPGSYQVQVIVTDGHGAAARIQFPIHVSIGDCGCTPDCGNKQCGDDGCGGSCGGCDSGDSCTIGTCDAASGQCEFIAVDCAPPGPCETFEGCEPGTAQCLYAPVDCDDGDACTLELCNPVTNQCENAGGVDCFGSGCQLPVGCDPATGQCIFETVPGCCGSDADCEVDGTLCTADYCDVATGECQVDIVDCFGDACTTASCDPATGSCEFEPVMCEDDGNLCTLEGCSLATGQCEVLAAVDCFPGPCEIASCNPGTGQCEFEPVPGCCASDADCETDGSLCTLDTCDLATGQCEVAIVDCFGSDACEDASCDPATGACEVSPVVCPDDGDPCTNELCDPVAGCVSLPVNCPNGQSCVEGLCEDTGGDPDVLIITEIMQNPQAVGDASGEWFEVFNPGSTPVSLEGWILSDDDFDSHEIVDPITVPPLSWFVFGRDGDEGVNGGVLVDYMYSGFTLGNAADEVVLLRPDGTEADRVNYDGGVTFPQPAGASMSLTASALNAADNDFGANWCEATMAFGLGDLGTPGEPNFECGAAP